MKTNRVFAALSVVLFAGIGAHAEEESVSLLKPQVVAHDAVQKGAEAIVITLNADEQAFVAQLNDQNRKIFSNRLDADQRNAVLVAVENGAEPNEAVHRMSMAMEIRANSMIVQAESESSESASR